VRRTKVEERHLEPRPRTPLARALAVISLV
jgi:hypothetical protein